MENKLVNVNKKETPLYNKPLSRRKLLGGAATAAVVLVQTAMGKTVQAAVSEAAVSTDDPTKKPGPLPSELGTRSPFEKPIRKPSGTSSRTPLQDLYSTITPADLHYERHHAGVPTIHPEEYKLYIHGLVKKPMQFTLADLK